MDEENSLEQAGDAMNNDQSSVKGACLETKNLEGTVKEWEEDGKTESKDKEVASCEKRFDMFDSSFEEEKSNGKSTEEKMNNQVDNTIDSLESNSFKALASTEKPCELLCKENPDDASVILSQNGDESQTSHREAKKRKSEDDVSSDSNDDDDFMDAEGESLEVRSKINKKFKRYVDGSSSSSDSDNDDISNSSQSSSSKESSSEQKEEKLREEQQWLDKDICSLPKPRWKALDALRQRETLRSSIFWPVKVCGSQAMVKRFKLEAELERHNGCVNALHFNQSGTLIASGSDDLRVMLWDWVNNSKEPAVNYESGHKSNVFQAKFLPNCNDATVVSSARDGQVRVADISTTGSCRGTKKVAQHRGSAHKLALDADARSTFLSCGEDGVVFGIDLRSDKPADKLVTVKVDNKKIPLYSIHCNPSRSYEFAVSGKEDSARIYDRRMLTDDESTTPVKLYSPHHLKGTDTKANITCLVYNWDGSELLCSYNDEDIYLFDTTHSSEDNYVKRYKGHRNNATVKGVNFYGPYSEYVVSGSDCGHIFFWEKSSSRVVTLVKGDEGGVVNVLEPHPNLPMIATSGLDHEVKIWSPYASHDRDDVPDLHPVMLANRRSREEDRHSWREMMIDEHMLWFLMRTLRSRRRDAGNDGNDDTSSDDEESPDTSSDASSEDEDRFCVQS